MITIKSLSINSLRGIKELNLSLDGKGLIFGENGTGKSSIVDALEFFFTLQLLIYYFYFGSERYKGGKF